MSTPMGMYPNMMGLDPNNMAGNSAQGQSQQMPDFQAAMNNMAFYQNMYSNQQQGANQNQQPN